MDSSIDIQLVPFRHHLEWLVDEHWPCVSAEIPSVAAARKFLKDNGRGRVYVFNGATFPEGGEVNYASKFKGSPRYFTLYFEDKQTAVLFKIFYAKDNP